MKDVEGVAETRFRTDIVYVIMGNNSVKNSSIKNPNPCAHLHIAGRKSTKFQMYPMTDAEEIMDRQSLSQQGFELHQK